MEVLAVGCGWQVPLFSKGIRQCGGNASEVSEYQKQPLAQGVLALQIASGLRDHLQELSLMLAMFLFPRCHFLATVRDRLLGWTDLYSNSVPLLLCSDYLLQTLSFPIFTNYKTVFTSEGCAMLPQSKALIHLAKKNTDLFFPLPPPGTTWDEVSL